MPVTCRVSIAPVRPLALEGLPVGSRLRVEASASGSTAPKMPAWSWTIQQQTSGLSINPTVVEMNPAVIEFPLDRAGNYNITARAAAGCQTTVTATATDHPVARFWLRVIPRASEDQPLEGVVVEVPAGTSVTRDLPCDMGVLVSIDPRDATNTQAIFSYVRITADRSTVQIEGHTRSGQLSARLDPAFTYDVLVIPDAQVAPLLFRGNPVQIAQNLFTLDPGVAIGGQVLGPNGAVAGTRVLLRNGVVPSTIGVVSGGEYELRARAGSDFAASIIPPLNAGLPEARLPAGSNLALYEPLPPHVGLDFTWSPISTATLDLSITDSTGAAVTRPVRVRLASVPDAFPDVGILSLTLPGAGGQMDQRFDYHPAGSFVRDGTSDARGAITFSNVPRASYTATLSPLDGSAAITTVPIDLRGSAGRVPVTAKLAHKIALSGRLLPATTTAGLTVVALDADADPSLPAPSALVDRAGGYVLDLDPGRSYNLVLEAVPARSLPRTFLSSIVARYKDSVGEDLTVPSGLSISGRVISSRITGGVRSPISGARVEAYCIGRMPGCMDLQSPGTSNVRPTAEAISDGDGVYHLLVPDPATPN